jgi:hypothetical protein
MSQDKIADELDVCIGGSEASSYVKGVHVPRQARKKSYKRRTFTSLKSAVDSFDPTINASTPLLQHADSHSYVAELLDSD